MKKFWIAMIPMLINNNDKVEIMLECEEHDQ